MIFMNNNMHTLVHYDADNFYSLPERAEAANKKRVYIQTLSPHIMKWELSSETACKDECEK